MSTTPTPTPTPTPIMPKPSYIFCFLFLLVPPPSWGKCLFVLFFCYFMSWWLSSSILRLLDGNSDTGIRGCLLSSCLRCRTLKFPLPFTLQPVLCFIFIRHSARSGAFRLLFTHNSCFRFLNGSLLQVWPCRCSSGRFLRSHRNVVKTLLAHCAHSLARISLLAGRNKRRPGGLSDVAAEVTLQCPLLLDFL